MEGMEIDILGSTMRMFVSLGAILGIVGVGLYILRRSPWGVRFAPSRRELIQVLSRCSLGPRESLCLVRVEKEVVLLGLSGSQITPLLRFTEEPEGEGWKAGSHMVQVNGVGKCLESCGASDSCDASRREG